MNPPDAAPACDCAMPAEVAASSPDRKVTHRVGLTLGVHAADNDEAGRIAEAFYERFAKEVREIDGVLWLLPVADIKEAR